MGLLLAVLFSVWTGFMGLLAGTAIGHGEVFEKVCKQKGEVLVDHSFKELTYVCSDVVTNQNKLGE